MRDRSASAARSSTAASISEKRRSSVSTTEVNAIEPLQAYIATDFSEVVTAKAGRFVLNLGSRRLVARNNFRNTINGFTGVQGVFGDAKLGGTAFWTVAQTRLPSDIDGIQDNKVELDRERGSPHFSGWIPPRQGGQGDDRGLCLSPRRKRQRRYPHPQSPSLDARRAHGPRTGRERMGLRGRGGGPGRPCARLDQDRGPHRPARPRRLRPCDAGPDAPWSVAAARGAACRLRDRRTVGSQHHPVRYAVRRAVSSNSGRPACTARSSARTSSASGCRAT